MVNIDAEEAETNPFKSKHQQYSKTNHSPMKTSTFAALQR
jgi:hypothetical protein